MGNLNALVQRDRNQFIKRLNNLSGTLKVRVETSLWGKEYQDALRLAKIVFNRSIRGEVNKRVFEALASDSLIFLEEKNEEIRDYFTPGVECVLYSNENLESLLKFYAEDDIAREAIIQKASKKKDAFSFPALLDRLHSIIMTLDLASAKPSQRPFLRLDPEEQFFHLTAQALNCSGILAKEEGVRKQINHLGKKVLFPEVLGLLLQFLSHRREQKELNADEKKTAALCFTQLRSKKRGRFFNFLNFLFLIQLDEPDPREEGVLEEFIGYLHQETLTPEEFYGSLRINFFHGYYAEICRLMYEPEEIRFEKIRRVMLNYALTRAGEICVKAKRMKEAAAKLEEAKAAWMGNPKTHQVLSEAYLSKDPQLALREAKQAYQADPFSVPIWVQLIGTCFATQRKEEAFQYIQEMKQMAPLASKIWNQKVPDLDALEQRCIQILNINEN